MNIEQKTEGNLTFILIESLNYMEKILKRGNKKSKNEEK